MSGWKLQVGIVTALVQLMLLGPAGTPRSIISRLHAETVAAVRSPGMTEQWLAQGAEPIGGTPQEFDAFLRGEIERWTKLIARANIRADP